MVRHQQTRGWQVQSIIRKEGPRTGPRCSLKSVMCCHADKCRLRIFWFWFHTTEIVMKVDQFNTAFNIDWTCHGGNKHGAIFKSPRVTGTLIVFGPFPPPSPPPPPFCQHFFNFPGKPLKLISSNHTWLTYGCGNIVWHPSRWPWVKVIKLPKRDAIYLVPRIKWEPFIQSLQNLVGITPLVTLSTWLNFGEILPEFFLVIFCVKI